MRGGKITTHAGSKHGLGGKQFQKGTQVGRQVMADSLDQRQPIMELTFSADPAIQGNQMVPNTQETLNQVDDDWQRLAIAYQQQNSGAEEKGSIENEINVDLHKLTRPLGRHQHLLGAIVPPVHSPPTEQDSREYLTPNTIQKHISKYVTTRMPLSNSSLELQGGSHLNSVNHMMVATDDDDDETSSKAILMRNMQFQVPRTASNQSLQQIEMQRGSGDHHPSQNQYMMLKGPKLESRPVQTQTRGQQEFGTPSRSIEPSELTSNPSNAVFDLLGKPPAKQLTSIKRDRSSENTLVLENPMSSQLQHHAPKKQHVFTPIQVLPVQNKQVEQKVSKMRVFDASNLNKAQVDPPKKHTSNRYSKYAALSKSQSPKQQSPKKSTSPARESPVVVKNTVSQASFAPFSSSPSPQKVQGTNLSPKRFISNHSIVDYQDKLNILAINPSQSTLNQGIVMNEVNAEVHQHTFGKNFGNIFMPAGTKVNVATQNQPLSNGEMTPMAPQASSFENQQRQEEEEAVQGNMLIEGEQNNQIKQVHAQPEQRVHQADDITQEELQTVIKDPKRFAEALAGIRDLNDSNEKRDEFITAGEGSDTTSVEEMPKERLSELHHGKPTTLNLNMSQEIIVGKEGDRQDRGQAQTMLDAAQSIDQLATSKHDSEAEYQVKVQYTRGGVQGLTPSPPLITMPTPETPDEMVTEEITKEKDAPASPGKSVLLNDQITFHSKVNAVKKVSARGNSADDSDGASVQRAIHQIESMKDSIDEDEGIFIEVQNQQIGIQGFPSLTQLDENCILERYKPMKKPREVLPPAIVDLLSGIKIQEKLKNMPPKGIASLNGATHGGSDVNDKGVWVESQMSIIRHDNHNPQFTMYDQGMMNRTTLVEQSQKVKNFTIYKLDPMEKNAQAFRDSSYPSSKKKNHMLRTTLAFKDERSSDTVSTEHNYLQPVVMKLGGTLGFSGGINQRASMIKSDAGSIIHVQEHNLESNDTDKEDLETSQINSVINRHLMVNQESQILFDAPAKNVVGQSTPLGRTPMSQLSQLPTITLKMPVKINKSQLKNQSKHHTRAVSKLSVDMRKTQKSPIGGNDLKAVQEPDTALFLPTDFTPTHTGASTMGFQKHKQTTAAMQTSGFADQHHQHQQQQQQLQQVQQMDTEKEQEQQAATQARIRVNEKIQEINSVELDTPIHVGGGGSQHEARMELAHDRTPKVSPTRALGGMLAQTGIGNEKSSKLLRNANSVDNMILHTTTAPGRAAIIASSNPNTSVGKKNSSRKNLNEMTFRPQAIQIFEPNIEMTDGMLSKQSSKESPRFLKQDLSSNSVRKSKLELLKQQQQARQQSSMMVVSQSSDTIEVKKFAVKDKSLHQPNFLTQSSLKYSNISEEKETGGDRGTTTQQSFTTIVARHNIESHIRDNSRADPQYETKMSNLMPAIFSTSFSQTYAELLKKVSPYEVRSELTESEFAYPGPVFKGSAKKKQPAFGEDSPTKVPDSPLIIPSPTQPKVESKPVHPEILFYLNVLERIQKTHKDVKSVEQVQELRKAYKKYISEGGADPSGGIFADIKSQKMDKPMMTISTRELKQDPEMAQQRIEMSVNRQYNIAAIMAEGVDNLPRCWKKLSPLNRLNNKLKINKTLNKLNEGVQTSYDIVLPNKTANRAPTESPKKLFKSLISSQQIGIEQQVLPSMTARSPNFQFQQTLFGELKNNTTSTILSQREYTQSPLDLDQSNSSKLPKEMMNRLKLHQVSQSLDYTNNRGNQQMEKEPVFVDQQKKMPKKHGRNKKIHTLSLEAHSIPISPTNQSVSVLSPVRNFKGGASQRAVSLHRKLGDIRSKDSLIVARLAAEATEDGAVVVQQEDTSAFLTQQEAQDSSTYRSKKAVAMSQEFTVGGDLSVKTKDPAANPRNPKSFLVQDSQFSDLFTFGKGKRRGLKERVGPSGHNPFLDEIEDRLRNPDGRTALLEKSIITRQDPMAQKKQWKPMVGKDKTIKVATKDIYDSIRVQKSIPIVPLHRMDTISKNLALSLLHESSQERIPMHEWKKQQVMLPILNTAKRDITLHTTAALCAIDIQKQKRVNAFDQTRQKKQKVAKSNPPRHLFSPQNDSQLTNHNLADTTAAADRQQRTSTQLSILSLLGAADVGRNNSSLMQLSVKSTFNNQTLRQATESPQMIHSGNLQQQSHR